MLPCESDVHIVGLFRMFTDTYIDAECLEKVPWFLKGTMPEACGSGIFGMFASTYIIMKSHRREMLKECALASAGERHNARASWTSMQDSKLPQKEWKSEQQNGDTLTRLALMFLYTYIHDIEACKIRSCFASEEPLQNHRVDSLPVRSRCGAIESKLLCQ
jgi:hypothetical protein